MKKILLLFTIILFFFANNIFAQNCTVNAGIDDDLCENQAITLDGNSQGLIDIAAKWEQISGPSTIIDDPNNLNSGVSGYTSGTYKYRIFATCEDGQYVADTVSYSIDPISDADAGGVNFESCPGGTEILSGSTPETGETGQWSIEGSNNAGVSFDDASDPNTGITLSNSGNGTSTVRWTITNGSCSTYDQIYVSNYGGETPITAGSDQTLGNCYTVSQSTDLNASEGGNGNGGQIGTWSLVSGPNYPTINDVNDNNTHISNLIEGTYVFRWTVEGPCASGSDEVTITVPAATQKVSDADAGDDIRFCNGATSAIITGSYPEYTDETVEWVQTGGPGGVTITNPNDPSTSVTGLDGSSTYTFRYTVTNDVSGCDDDDDMRIRYSDPTSINITDDDMFNNCGDTSITIHYTTSGGSSSQYQIINGPYTTNWRNAGSSSQTIKFTQTGTFVVQVRRFATGVECDDAYDQITLTVSKAPTPSNAGTDQILACHIVETELAGNEPEEGIGTWSQISGPNTAVIADIYDKSSNISGLIEGKYFFKWSISNGFSCPNEEDVVMVVVSTPTTSTTAAGADQNVCGNSSVYLHASPPADNETGTWRVSPSSGIVFSSINDPNATVTGVTQGETYEFIWRVENACAWDEDTAFVNVSMTAGPSIANAGPNQCQPDGTVSINMAGNNPSVGTGTWSYVSGPSTPVFDNTNDNNTTVNGLVNGTYVFEWAISKVGCQTTRDTVWVTATPDASIANTGTDITLCGTNTNLAATNPVVGTGTWKQINGNAGSIIDDVNSPTTNVSNLTAGTYWFEWSVAEGVCPATYDTVRVFVSNPPTTALAGSDQIICSDNQTDLAANAPTNGSGYWSIAGSSENNPTISNISDPTTNVSDLVTGEYEFTWNIISGPFCEISSDTVKISVSAPATAGDDQQLCNSSEVLLTGTDGTNGTWNKISGPAATITPLSSYSARASGLVLEGDYTFRYTVPTIYGCPETFKEVIIQTSPYGSVPDAGADQELCNTPGPTTSTVLTASSPGTGDGQWVVLSGPNTPVFDDDTNPLSPISNLISGLYILEWNVEYNWCANYSDIVRIEVFTPPTTAYAGNDQTTACVLDAQLEATAATTGIGTWSLVSGPGTIDIDNPNLANTYVSNPSALGTYTMRWTTVNGTVCANSQDDMLITFGSSSPPTTPNAGDNQQLCDANATSMTANAISTGTGTWSQPSGPVTATIASPNSENSNISGMTDAGIYKFVWKSEEGFCELTDTMTITISTPISANAGKDTTFCEFSTIQLNADDASPGTGTWTNVSGPTTPIFEDETLFSSRVAGTSIGTYVFKWTVENGSCSDESTVNVEIVSEPADDLSVVGDTECYHSDASVTINNSVNGVMYSAYIGTTYITQTTGTGNNIDLTIPWDEVAVGDNFITFIADNGSCQKSLVEQALVHVDACADLGITKVVNDTVKHVGAIIDFTIVVTNYGPSDATNTVVTDIIPSGYSYDSDNSGGSYNSGTGVWTVGNLAYGEDTSLTISAEVLISGEYNNVASVTATENDPDPTNNQDSTTVEAIPYSDLVIVKTVNNPTPDVGSNVIFTLTATNNGPNDAPGVVVNDTLPSGYTYVSDDSGGDYDNSTHIWTIGDLANGATVILNITVSVDTSGNYENIAYISGEVIEPDSTNNTDSVTPVPIPICDLEVEKTVDIEDAYVGSDVTFTIEATNNGPSNATGVTVLDKLPTGFTYVSDNSSGNYNSTTGIWTIGFLEAGTSETLEIVATVNVTGEYINSAVISGDQEDRITPNDSSAVTVTPVPSADLEIIKYANVEEEYVNDDVIFTLVVYNHGPSQATNVEVTDLIPTGYTYASDNSSSYNSSTGIWTIGTLDADDSISIEITVTINLMGDYVNIASVEGDEYDPNPDNNEDEDEVTIIRTILPPQAFSPNGDGINDIFRIKGLEDYPDNRIEIINRWGNIIYIKAPYLNEWDGKTTAGKDLPEGTYFYIIDLNDGTKPQKGYIYLKR